MIAPNIFKPRNDWNVKTLLCSKYIKSGLSEILSNVSYITGIKTDDIKDGTRKREIVEARFFYCYRARRYTKHTFESIGRLINRDHASVLHGIRMVDECKEIKDRYNELFTK
jgi:chromosomal replication initiation ATPase DnaA